MLAMVTVESLKVLRDFGVKLLIMPQITEALDIAERPFVADDTDPAVEPVHLDKASLDRLIAVGDGAAVGASAPRADVYEGLNSLAAFFETNILIVETWPEQETAWIKAISEAKVNLPLIVCSIEATRP